MTVLKPIAPERLDHLRTAAEVGIRMSALQPQTVHVVPEELASLIDEVHVARAQERPSADVACRTCGCTDADCSACIERTGAPCYWVEADLCSACIANAGPLKTIDVLARGLAMRHGAPAAMLMMLDANGGLHIGCAAVDHPISAGFVATAKSIDIAIERGMAGFQSISRERAVELAGLCAKAKRESYYAEPFAPHEWVVDAILVASSALPATRTKCFHCMQEVADVDDLAANHEHARTCEKSPVAREFQRLRTIVEQAETVARHWEAQDGINGAELDKLRDIVFDRPGAG